MKSNNSKHQPPALPTARKIRRACSNELYRTVKRMKLWISPELVQQAETLYFKKVAANLLFVHENYSNRKLLADWWDEHVCPEIAELWGVDKGRLSAAFRDAFGG